MANRKLEILINARDKASKVFRGVEDSGSRLSNSLGKLKGLTAGLFAGGLAAGGAVLVAELKESIDLAKEQIRVEKQLDAVLTSTGQAAGITADEVKSLASAFQATTNFGDEATIAGQNLLLTFTNIGADVFPMTTQTMLDMSAALGQDLKQSAIQLGKALNDPVTGVGALQEVGVSFTESQKETINRMVEFGDVAGAQTLILQELQREFGGSAEAAREADAGSIALSNAWGDLQEVIGTGLLPAQRKWNDALRESIEGWTSFLQGHQQAKQSFEDERAAILESSNSYEDYIQKLNDLEASQQGLLGAGGIGSLWEGAGESIGATREEYDALKRAAEEADEAARRKSESTRLEAQAQAELAEQAERAAQAERDRQMGLDASLSPVEEEKILRQREVVDLAETPEVDLPDARVIEILSRDPGKILSAIDEVANSWTWLHSQVIPQQAEHGGAAIDAEIERIMRLNDTLNETIGLYDNLVGLAQGFRPAVGGPGRVSAGGAASGEARLGAPSRI